MIKEPINKDCSNTRRRTSIYIREDMETKINFIKEEKSFTSTAAVIDKAINFYYGYLSGSISQDYLCGVLGRKLEAAQRRSTDQIARLQYKQSVEINMLIRLIAEEKSISKDKYEKIRKKSIQDVNSVRGIINVYEAGLDDVVKGSDEDKK